MTHFILCSGYHFADGIQQTCKEVVDLQFVHPNDAKLSGIFFPKITDMKLVYKLMGTQLSLFTTFLVCFFQFISVLPARYVRMRIFMGKSKQTKVIYILLVHFFFHNGSLK